MVVFGISVCNREKFLYSGKVVVFEARVVVFGLKWLYNGKSGCIREMWLHSGKSGFI